jgi:branched-chain amino acid transport system permease protein
MAIGDTAYYRYVVVVCALMFLLALLHVASKPGRAWASIRESEPAALAAGVNITLYKMWAFALASFMTGVAGCLLAAQVGQPTRDQSFQTQDSLTLPRHADRRHLQLWGAVVAGVFNQLVPFLFQAQWGVNPNFLLIIFGVGPAAGAADRSRRARRSSSRRTWRTSHGSSCVSSASWLHAGGVGMIEVQA